MCAGGTGAPARALVVTREQAYANGRPIEGGPHWNVYLAGARRVSGGWVISRWESLR